LVGVVLAVSIKVNIALNTHAEIFQTLHNFNNINGIESWTCELTCPIKEYGSLNKAKVRHVLFEQCFSRSAGNTTHLHISVDHIIEISPKIREFFFKI
jgi:hypothetical protein